MKFAQFSPVATLKPTLLAAAIALASTATAAPPLQTFGNYDISQAKSANAWLEVDVSAFENNVGRLMRELDGKSKVCVIMKADAYGNGIDLLMPSVIKLGVPCIGIASNEEARVARAHGYQGVIARVRAASIDEIEAALPYQMEELIGNLNHAKALDALAAKHGQKIKYHLSLNAGGMDRNGLDLADGRGKGDALQIVALPNLELTGIMTHFAVEDEDFVRTALALFNEQSSWLIDTAKLDRSKLTLHAANSFATIAVPESHLDMVRPGGLVYGDTIDAKPAYEPVMSFKSRVAAVHFYKAGTKVGYDGTHTLTRDSYLANLPFGYSDGYRRAFTNKGVVLIRGHRAPVLGKTSMNTTMVDVTDFPDVVAGDEVVIYGKQGAGEITQAEIEDINDALLADLYTIWGNSNPKIKKP
ncbi:alanine racemase [Moraxella caviae]|uniref:Broad specificity amino-acid racemase n=1 Tax=Moraxella caviae TaxID=34060 RepID=A0A1T0A1B2_9GAMM|nr:alanine racemase [Moraxella caviae]OOR89566.1 alanine racemase [Moraxella caviae]STZ10246.1 Alanine racemase [Moraxella caviae]